MVFVPREIIQIILKKRKLLMWEEKLKDLDLRPMEKKRTRNYRSIPFGSFNVRIRSGYQFHYSLDFTTVGGPPRVVWGRYFFWRERMLRDEAEDIETNHRSDFPLFQRIVCINLGEFWREDREAWEDALSEDDLSPPIHEYEFIGYY